MKFNEASFGTFSIIDFLNFNSEEDEWIEVKNKLGLVGLIPRDSVKVNIKLIFPNTNLEIQNYFFVTHARNFWSPKRLI